MATTITTHLHQAGTTTTEVADNFLFRFQEICQSVVKDCLNEMKADISAELARRLCWDACRKFCQLSRSDWNQQRQIMSEAVNTHFHRHMKRKRQKTDLMARFYLVEARRFWIGITCDGCDRRRYKLIGGCLLCCRHHDELQELLADTMFMALLKNMRQDTEDAGRRFVLADWLEEYGHMELGELFRKR